MDAAAPRPELRGPVQGLLAGDDAEDLVGLLALVDDDADLRRADLLVHGRQLDDLALLHARPPAPGSRRVERARGRCARASGGDGRARPRDRVGAGARRPMVGVARRRVARYLPPEEAKLRASRRLSGWTVRTRARALIANMAVSRERRIACAASVLDPRRRDNIRRFCWC